MPLSENEECTVDYIRPHDWCLALWDVASASDLPAAAKLPRRSATMSNPLLSEHGARGYRLREQPSGHL